jgi:hypothetical protein
MHPIFVEADRKHREISAHAEAAFAALQGKTSTAPAIPAAAAPAPAAAPRVPTAAEAEAQRIASFSKLSPSDQELLARFGLSPFAPSTKPLAPFAPAVPVLSAYDEGAREAARLLGYPVPAASGEINLAPSLPAPGLNADEYARGEADAMRLLGKKRTA